ncbi:MAG: HAD family hydrolase [Spirochaetes bacterium]|nr:HAD family hydrolase [Spirochaetota bacterium]
MKKRGTVVFFDLGDTLEDESRCHQERARIAAEICREQYPQITEAYFLQRQHDAGTSGAVSCFSSALAGLVIDTDTRMRIQEHVRWNKEMLSADPGAHHLLTAIDGRYQLGIIANQSSNFEKRLSQYGIRGYFDIVICSCDVGMQKPDDGIFRHAESLVHESDTTFWMIGDRVDNDIVPAKKRGWKTVRYLHGNYRDYVCTSDAERPDYEITDLRELVGILA